MNIVAIERLNHWYGHVLSLNDVSFVVGAGITGLLGPNGAGKTSLLRILIGLMRPSGGRVRVLGEDPWNNPALAVRIGYSPEHDGFYEWMPGRGFLRLLLGLRGFAPAEARRRAEEAIERVGLRDAADRAIGTYSRGMRQRLKLAQAVAHDPEFLVLDEPLTGTDPLVRMELIRLIRSFGAGGRGVIVSSHVLQEIEQLTREIVLVHKGRLIAAGNVQDIRGLIDRYPHSVRIRTERAREMAAALAREPSVAELSFDADGRGLTVRTRVPDMFYDRLARIALEAGAAPEEIFSPDDNLEAVFRYLTEK
ncbi:MAG: ABC transporter ATP-binding protein [Planctomycetes bacterium]|nr:ABC transporter ATP-binding protein [Planctomycetota bacterium]